MKTITANLPIAFIFDPINHKRACYSLDGGENWMNHGEYCERMAKAILGYKPTKDSVAFDKGHDLPELQASIKSYKCGLSDCKNMPENPKDFLKDFWKRETAKMFIYVCDHGDYMNLYLLNRSEFRMFVNRFFKWEVTSSRHNFRMYTCDNKVERWLHENFPVK